MKIRFVVVKDSLAALKKNKKYVKPHVCVMCNRSFLRELETTPFVELP